MNYRIGRKKRANRILVASSRKTHGQGAGRSCVALFRFCDDVLGWKKGQFLANGFGLSRVRENKDPVPRDEILDAAHGSFQKGPVAQQTEQMLRRLRAAKRPESLAAPSRKNVGKEMVGHGGSYQRMMFATLAQSKPPVVASFANRASRSRRPQQKISPVSPELESSRPSRWDPAMASAER